MPSGDILPVMKMSQKLVPLGDTKDSLTGPMTFDAFHFARRTRWCLLGLHLVCHTVWFAFKSPIITALVLDSCWSCSRAFHSSPAVARGLADATDVTNEATLTVIVGTVIVECFSMTW